MRILCRTAWGGKRHEALISRDAVPGDDIVARGGSNALSGMGLLALVPRFDMQRGLDMSDHCPRMTENAAQPSGMLVTIGRSVAFGPVTGRAKSAIRNSTSQNASGARFKNG